MAKKIKPKVCKYSHCKHEIKIISPETDDFQEENGRYYHSDCKLEMDKIKKIIDQWTVLIKGKTSYSYLRQIINDLVYNKGYSPEYISFVIDKNAHWLKSPGGLYYAVDDYKTKSSWEYQIKLNKYNSEKKTVEIVSADEPVFEFQNKPKTSFSSIFGGK